MQRTLKTCDQDRVLTEAEVVPSAEGNGEKSGIWSPVNLDNGSTDDKESSGNVDVIDVLAGECALVDFGGHGSDAESKKNSSQRTIFIVQRWDDAGQLATEGQRELGVQRAASGQLTMA